MKNTKYYFEKNLDLGFDEAVQKTTDEFKNHGFGVLTEINLHEKFKDKLGKDFRKYRILGACNPSFAYKALQIDDKIGTLLPCSIIIQELSEGKTNVAVIDPYSSMKELGSDELLTIASEAGDELRKAVENL